MATPVQPISRGQSILNTVDCRYQELILYLFNKSGRVDGLRPSTHPTSPLLFEKIPHFEHFGGL